MLGVAATYWRGRWPETLVDGLAGLAMAIPDFLWGLLFILGLGVLLPVLPISGRLDPRLDLREYIAVLGEDFRSGGHPEALERLAQGAAAMRRRKYETDLVAAGARRVFASDDEEARRVLGAVLNTLADHV